MARGARDTNDAARNRAASMFSAPILGSRASSETVESNPRLLQFQAGILRVRKLKNLVVGIAAGWRHCLALSADGSKLYVADYGNHLIRQIHLNNRGPPPDQPIDSCRAHESARDIPSIINVSVAPRGTAALGARQTCAFHCAFTQPTARY